MAPNQKVADGRSLGVKDYIIVAVGMVSLIVGATTWVTSKMDSVEERVRKEVKAAESRIRADYPPQWLLDDVRELKERVKALERNI